MYITQFAKRVHTFLQRPTKGLNAQTILKILFLGSFILMALHQLEGYYTNEFNACPVYHKILLHIVNKGVLDAAFKMFIMCFFAFLLIMATLILNDYKLPLFWQFVWLGTFIYEIHHHIQTFFNESYYSGTVTADLYVIYGFFFAWYFFKVHYPKKRKLMLWGYFGTLIIYGACLCTIDNAIVMRKPADYHGFVIDYKKSVTPSALKGKVCLISGGSRGISKEIAKHFVEAGATVIVACRSVDKCKLMAKRHNNMEVIYLDLSKKQSMTELVQKVENDYGRIDILILAAGIYANRRTDENYRINYMGNRNLVVTLLPLLQKSKSAQIMETTSIAVLFQSQDPNDGVYKNKAPELLYANSKYLLFKYLEDLNKEGLRVNHFHPGVVRTASSFPMIRYLPMVLIRGLEKVHLMNPPSQVAKAMVQFCVDPEYSEVDKTLFNVHIEEKVDL